MLKQNIIIVMFIVLLISFQQVSCSKVLVGKQKRMYFRKQRIQFDERDDTTPFGLSLTGSPTTAASGVTTIDTSNLFSSISSVSGVTQQLPSLGATTPQRATGATQLYPYAPPAPPTAPPKNKDEDDEEEDNEEDEDDD